MEACVQPPFGFLWGWPVCGGLESPEVDKRNSAMRSAANIARVVAAACLLMAGSLQAAIVGSKAPTLEPTDWLNTKGNLTWDALKGRVVLIEKWATF